jgi:hypothetical protein
MTMTFCAAAGRPVRGGVCLALEDNSELRRGEAKPLLLCIDGTFRAGDKLAK